MEKEIDEALEIVKDAGLTPVMIGMNHESYSSHIEGQKYKGLRIVINNRYPKDKFYISVEHNKQNNE